MNSDSWCVKCAKYLTFGIFETADDSALIKLEQDVATLFWGTWIQIVRGVANGLSFLHSLDKPIIANQDMKSRNVFLNSDFQAQITDFGLVRGIDTSTSYVSTQFV